MPNLGCTSCLYLFIPMFNLMFLSLSQHNDGLPGSVFQLSRGSFSSPSNLPPWRSGNPGSYRKSHRRAPSSESLSGLERLIRACSHSDPSDSTTTLHDPYEPLLPLLIGPCVRVWRGCYLRGVLHAQVNSDGSFFWIWFVNITLKSICVCVQCHQVINKFLLTHLSLFPIYRPSPTPCLHAASIH